MAEDWTLWLWNDGVQCARKWHTSVALKDSSIVAIALSIVTKSRLSVFCHQQCSLRLSVSLFLFNEETYDRLPATLSTFHISDVPRTRTITLALTIKLSAGKVHPLQQNTILLDRWQTYEIAATKMSAYYRASLTLIVKIQSYLSYYIVTWII